MIRFMPLVEQLAATLGAYVAVQVVRRLHVEHQIAVAMRRIEKEINK